MRSLPLEVDFPRQAGENVRKADKRGAVSRRVKVASPQAMTEGVFRLPPIGGNSLSHGYRRASSLTEGAYVLSDHPHHNKKSHDRIVASFS